MATQNGTAHEFDRDLRPTHEATGPRSGDALGLALQAAWNLGAVRDDVPEHLEFSSGLIASSSTRRYFDERSSWEPLDRWLSDHCKGSILDLGTGAGRFALELSKGGHRVTGVDLSHGATAVARERGLKDVRCADWRTPPVTDRYDTVTMLGNNLGLLGQFTTPAEALAKLARLIRPGGRLVASAGRADSLPADCGARVLNGLHSFTARVRHRDVASPWFDYAFFEVDELVALLLRNGWTVSDLDTAPGQIGLIVAPPGGHQNRYHNDNPDHSPDHGPESYRPSAVSPPLEHVLRADLMTAYVVRGAAASGLLERLREEWTIEALARNGYDVEALGVLLPAFCHLGVTERVGEDRFRLTKPAARFLTAPLLEALGTDGLGTRIDEAARCIAQTLLEGGVPYVRTYGLPFWRDLSERPTEARRFHAYLELTTRTVASELAPVTDWSAIDSVVDLGGGRGVLIQELARFAPHLNLTVVDQPSVLPLFEGHSLASFVAADLLTEPLPPAGAFILSRVIHDWTDHEVELLLTNVARSMGKESELIVVERCVHAEETDAAAALMSLRMFVLFGARERSEREIELLAARANYVRKSSRTLSDGFVALVFKREP